MAYSITQFENNLTNSLVALDNNFTTFGALVPIPCGIAGTNALTLTQNAAGLVPAPTISAYTTGMLFAGIAAGTNTGPATATVGTAGILNVYKDSSAGPVLLGGGEIVSGNAISLRYDAALNSGTGGFHLTSGTATTLTPINPTSVQINGGSTLTNLLSGTVALTFSATPAWFSQDQTFTLTGVPPLLPALGDFVQVNPPSLAAAGVAYAGYVSAVGSLSSVASVATVAIRLINSASASLASNSGIYRYKAERTVP
jgi:hypothetical protein